MFRSRLRLVLFSLLFALMVSPAFSQEKLTLNLEKSLDTAYKNNRGRLAQKEKILTSQFKISEARAGFYPRLSLQGSYTYLGVVPSFVFSMPGLGTRTIPMGFQDNYNFKLVLQQPIFTWGRLRNAYSISKRNLELEEESYRKDKQRITVDVTSSFYSVLLGRELISVREESLKNIEEHLRAVELRYKAGEASEFDLLRAKVQLANAKPTVLEAKQTYDMALRAFKLVLGLTQETEVELEGELSFKPMETDVETATQEVLSRRPELRSLAIQENITRSGLSIAKAGNKPALVGLINYAYENPFYGVQRWDTDWNFTIALNLPLFDGFTTKSQVSQAQSGLRQLELGRKDLTEAIKLEVRDAVNSLDLATERILSQEENIKQSKEGLRIAKIQYLQGMITSLEEMDAELALTYARISYLQALADHLIAQAKYKKALGAE
ncbi:MAG: TolC family protein [Candidatus Eisenbacteria bacterium]|nr:TolC family protein [Candidatus Eisenbacteria bacterium]